MDNNVSQNYMKLLAPVLALVISACGVQTNASSGVTDQVCATISAAQTAMTSLNDPSTEKTVGDTVKKIDDFISSLDVARSQAKGLAQALIVNYSTTVAQARGLLDSVDQTAAVSQLPEGFAAIRSSLKTGFDKVVEKTGCAVQ